MNPTSLIIALILLASPISFAQQPITLNQKDTGYRGIWYMNSPLNTIYKYKYSGGLGTYCAKHKPFAVYRKEVNKTFFCYGGTTTDSNKSLVHMVSYYDHTTNQVPKPTLLLNKKTSDAHDNPVITIDDRGHIWIFSTSHGTSRPSYIHRSKKPYDIDQFERVNATRLEDGKQIPITNFSYMQAWYIPNQGFFCFFTKYGWGAKRAICYMTSKDGYQWSQWRQLATIKQGHYQVTAANQNKAASAFNYHPEKTGLNFRTNLYYMQTSDLGQTWTNAKKQKLNTPLNDIKNKALIHDYESEGLKVYVKDIRFDHNNQPVILFITSKGYESGPKNDPRTWNTAHFDGQQWNIRPVTTSDNNYDMGSLYIEPNGDWRIIAPTETGPQPYNPGGEMALWISNNQGRSWRRQKQITHNSTQNHTYARAPLNAHNDFFAFWADGHGRMPSQSNLYFSTKSGDVFVLPRKMTQPFQKPQRIITP